MNEITRIHIAKVAYDIEVGAKKELEKYIKSLETYTQDSEVLADIEIRMTELLAERNVAASGVISADDVTAIRAQLGEPHEFADEDGDIAVGVAPGDEEGRRLYRSLDDAVLGGVLSGMAAYFKVNALWPRLIFILLAFVSFGLAVPLYLVLWIIIPPARTAAEKLQLAGKPVTLGSIRELNAAAEVSPPRPVAPALQRVLGIALGIMSIFAAIGTLAVAIWGAVIVFNRDGGIYTLFGSNQEPAGFVWVVFWIGMAGMLLLAALFSLIAYAFIAKKVTKRIITASIVIIALGIMSVVAVVGIATTQTWRVSSEAQSAVQTKKLTLPKEFATVTSVVFDNPSQPKAASYHAAVSSIQYVVDEGAPRYELSALPNAKLSLKIENGTARVSLHIPNDYRNAYVQPSLVIYGPALSSFETSGVRVNYSNLASQDALKITSSESSASVTVNGTYQSVVVEGKGYVDVSSSAVQSLDVRSAQALSLTAGTVRELIVTQPDVCASTTYGESTTVTVSGVTSGSMTYNGKQVPAVTYHSNCASVIIGDDDEE